MDSEEELDLLNSLLAESQPVGLEDGDLDLLFDGEDGEDEEYHDRLEEVEGGDQEDAVVSTLFGDVDDLEEKEVEDEEEGGQPEAHEEVLNKSREDLQGLDR